MRVYPLSHALLSRPPLEIEPPDEERNIGRNGQQSADGIVLGLNEYIVDSMVHDGR